MTRIYNSLWFRILVFLWLLLALARFSLAQVQLGVPLVKGQWFDNNGHVLSNGCIFTYISGTNTPLATYTDFTGLVVNSNPVVLTASGRPPNDIWLTGGSAYRIRLVTAGGSNCSSGFTVWTEDGISVGFASLLASNNVWTGTNTWQSTSTFNGSVTFNTGFTSNGPSNLTAGGALAGTFTGTPTFSGTINLSGGFVTTTGTFSGQLISTLATGTPPFVVASTTKVANLNVDQLDGCDWAVPCPLGSTTPNTASITTLLANSFTLNGGTPQVGTIGTDTHLPTAGSLSGATGTPVCKDANGGLDTTCSLGYSKVQVVTYCASGCTQTGTPCTTGNSSYDQCSNTLSWPTVFADTNYSVTCNGVTPNDASNAPNNGRAYLQVNTKTTGSVNVMSITTGAAAINWTEIDCIGVHP